MVIFLHRVLLYKFLFIVKLANARIMKKIIIYTDGSCKGNPGPGGWAALLLENETDKTPFKILKGNSRATTNNRMEMMAMIEALKFVQKNNLNNSVITLFSDSNLLIQTLNQGWKKKANQDLWEQLDTYSKGLLIDYVWVKAHATNHWNNECDKVAQKEASLAMRKVGLDF